MYRLRSLVAGGGTGGSHTTRSRAGPSRSTWIGITGQPNKALGDAFHAAVDKAQKLAQAKIDKDARDASGLLALTMTNGMLADYSSLIEKKQMATLHLLSASEGYAQRLLAVDAGAPVLGAGLSLLITPGAGMLSILLAMFCGFSSNIEPGGSDCGAGETECG